VNDRLFDVDEVRREGMRQVISGALSREPDVVFAYLHGSFVGTLPFHDIDVAIYFSDGPSSHTQRIVELADRLASPLGYPVDVRALNDAPLSFAFRAMQGELLVSHDDAVLADVLERTGRRYLDIAPILRRATRDAFAP
jgi:uncharacterized protein